MTKASSLQAILGTAACILMATSASAAGDAEAGKIKAETCKGCHASESYKNIYPTYRVPKLVGQGSDYLAAALKAYRSGDREHPTMRSQAGSMSDQDIADIVAYLSSLTK